MKQRLLHTGLIYFRFPLASATTEKIHRLRGFVAEHSDLLDQFVVITPAGFRVLNDESHNEQLDASSSTVMLKITVINEIDCQCLARLGLPSILTVRREWRRLCLTLPPWVRRGVKPRRDH